MRPVAWLLLTALTLGSCTPAYRGHSGPVTPGDPQTTPDRAATQAWDRLDVFPIPAPKASAQAAIPNNLLVRTGRATPRLGDVAAKLSKALDAAGYYERSYRPAPGGFALLTRVERMNEDGTSVERDRFKVSMTSNDLRPFTLTGYLRALLTANPGYYRIIAFVVTDNLARQGSGTASAELLKGWVARGVYRLPAPVAAIPYDARYSCVAFIYQFKVTNAARSVTLLDPSPQLGRAHLEKAGVWAALSR